MGVGLIMSIIIGGFAGWLASKFMDMRFGLILNIIIGIVGSVVFNAIFNRLGIFVAYDKIGYLISSFIGAVILLFFVKLVRR